MEGKQTLILADKDLAAIVYDNDKAPMPGRRYEDLLKHFEYAKKECKKTGVNKQILWIEYSDQYPQGINIASIVICLRSI